MDVIQTHETCDTDVGISGCVKRWVTLDRTVPGGVVTWHGDGGCQNKLGGGGSLRGIMCVRQVGGI